jgi:hypothetical protein
MQACALHGVLHLRGWGSGWLLGRVQPWAAVCNAACWLQLQAVTVWLCLCMGIRCVCLSCCDACTLALAAAAVRARGTMHCFEWLLMMSYEDCFIVGLQQEAAQDPAVDSRVCKPRATRFCCYSS